MLKTMLKAFAVFVGSSTLGHARLSFRLDNARTTYFSKVITAFRRHQFWVLTMLRHKIRLDFKL